MCLYKSPICNSEELKLQRTKDDGGNVRRMNANLPSGFMSSSTTEHSSNLLLFFEVHSVDGVEFHTVSLSVELPGNSPGMLELSR